MFSLFSALLKFVALILGMEDGQSFPPPLKMLKSILKIRTSQEENTLSNTTT